MFKLKILLFQFSFFVLTPSSTEAHQELTQDICAENANITVLQLSWHNITTIRNDSLNACADLEHIHLDHNGILTMMLRVFLNKPKLKELNLYRNYIAFMVDDLFDGLYALEILDLGFNRLNFFTSRYLEDLSQLKQLNLAQNFIRELHPAELFKKTPSLKSFGFTANEVNCNSIQVIMAAASENGIDLSTEFCEKLRRTDLAAVSLNYITFYCLPDAVWHRKY